MEVFTDGVLTITTGIIMGDVANAGKVASYLLDRPAYIHELSYYLDRMQAAVLICHPALPDRATNANWRQILDAAVARWGKTICLDPALKGVLADEKDPVETLRAMGFSVPILTVS